MRHAFLFLTLFILVMACSPTGVEIEIRNRSERAIDSIRVSTSSNTSEIIFVRINGGETQSGFLSLENEQVLEGRILVTYRAGSSTFIEPIHYFANGTLPDKKFSIVVAPNGVSF